MQMYIPHRPSPQLQPVAQELSGEFRSRRIGAGEISAFWRRSALKIVILAMVMGGLALVYLRIVPASYRATAEVMVEGKKTPYFFTEPNNASEPLTPEARVESQIEIIRSDDVASRVIRQLRLASLPEFSQDTVSPLLDTLGLARYVKAVETAVTSFVEASPLTFDETRRRSIEDIFAGRLSVNRVGQSMVIDVTFRSRDAALAAKVANAVVDAYRTADIDSKSESADQARAWLLKRLDDLKKESNDSRFAIEEFKRTGFHTDGGFSQMRLAELQSIADSRRETYNTFLQKLNEMNQRVSFPEPDSRIVTSAAVPLHPSPSRTLIVAFAAMLGGMVGAGISLARTSADRRVRSPGQIVAETGIDCLGTVSQLPSRYRRRLLFPSAQTKASAALINLQNRRMSPMLRTVLDHPSSSLARDLRAVKTFISTAVVRTGPSTIGIVAPRAGQGATTIASNLALLYAMAGERTLLVDTCIDNPVVSTEFALPSQNGLMEALDDPDIAAAVLRKEGDCRFAVLPVGKRAKTVTPCERFASNNTALHLADLKKRYDVVIIDLPALSQSADAVAVAPHLDGLLMVVTPNETTADELAQCARSLNNGSLSILGVIINKWNPRLEH